MITKRLANERGHNKFSWLEAKHSFSFGSYFDPSWMGYKSLRVINEDIIDEGMGFGTHPHKDMEIISLVIDGALEHKDTLGHHTTIGPGEIQIMSAGSGIMHSEYNPNKDQKTHMLQIWIEPKEKGIAPRHEQFNYDQTKNELIILASPVGGENIAMINQDASVFIAELNQPKLFEVKSEKEYWIQVILGAGSINEIEVKAGDALAISEVETINILPGDSLKFLLFEL